MASITADLCRALKKIPQVVCTQLTVAEDLRSRPGQSSRRRVSARRCSAIFVLHELMTASRANRCEARLYQGNQQLTSRNTGEPTHVSTVMRWMPTNSNVSA